MVVVLVDCEGGSEQLLLVDSNVVYVFEGEAINQKGKGFIVKKKYFFQIFITI